MVGLLLIGGCRNKKIFIFKGISATADAVRIQSSRQNNTKNGQFFLAVFFVLFYIYIPSPTPPFGKGRGLVADKACSELESQGCLCISATAAAGEASSKVKPQLSTLKNIKQKKADSKIAPIMQLQQVEKIQQTKELMPLTIQKGKQKALFVK